MTRNLKALGLALLAVFALGAIGAQAASAADAHEFKSAESTGVVTGKNLGAHEFSVGAVGIVKCTTAKFEATTEGGTELDQITVKPTYSNCEFGTQPATVFFNDCAYVFDSDTTEGNSTGGKHADVVVECAANNKIQIHTVNCTVTVSAQTIPDAVRYANDTTTSNETISTAHGIVVGKERNTAAQPVNGCLTFPTGAVGKYVGNATNECRKDEGEKQANPTTPTGTKDTASQTCEVTGV